MKIRLYKLKDYLSIEWLFFCLLDEETYAFDDIQEFISDMCNCKCHLGSRKINDILLNYSLLFEGSLDSLEQEHPELFL